MFHISIAYGVSETMVCRIIQDMESALLQHKDFHLPRKKVLTQLGNNFEIVLIDVAETPIERPKKGTQEKRSDTLSSRK